MQVTLNKPVSLEEVDTEIIVIAGCALGFVAQNQPPHVLHVDPGTEMANHGVQSDDLLVNIDGVSTNNMQQSEVAKQLRNASRLEFERPKGPPEGDEDTDPPSGGEGRTAVPLGGGSLAVGNAIRATGGPLLPSPSAPTAAPAPIEGGGPAAEPEEEPKETNVGRCWSNRRRSRSRRRRRRSTQHRGETRRGRASKSHNRDAERPAGSGPPHGGMQQSGLPPVPPWGAPQGAVGGWGAPPPWGGGPPPHAGYGLSRPPGPPRPGEQPPPPWGGGWRSSAPPDHWRGPHAPANGGKGKCAGPFEGASPPRIREHRGGGPRLERNDDGSASLVAERVPPSVNNMDVLNEFFGQFGPVSAMRINPNRHEAVVTFCHVEDAERALRWPVLNDPSIGLRPWRSKAGQRGPFDLPADEDVISGPLPTAGPPGPVYEGWGMAPVAVPDGGSAAPPAADAERPKPQNMQLESGVLSEKKRKLEEVELRRKKLLQGLTDQMKMVLAKINDRNTTEKNREKMQVLLNSLKEKLTALTPQRKEPERPRPMLPGRPGPGPMPPLPVDAFRHMSEWAEEGSVSQQVFNPAATAGAAVTAASPVFAPPVSIPQPVVTLALDDDNEAPEPAPPSCETEDMDSDIPDDELIGAMASAAAEAAAAQQRAAADSAAVADSVGDTATPIPEPQPEAVPAVEPLASAST